MRHSDNFLSATWLPRGLLYYYLDYYRRDSLTHPTLIIVFCDTRHEGQRESRKGLGFQSSGKRLVGFEPGTFRFIQNTLTHQATFPVNNHRSVIHSFSRPGNCSFTQATQQYNTCLS